MCQSLGFLGFCGRRTVVGRDFFVLEGPGVGPGSVPGRFRLRLGPDEGGVIRPSILEYI